MRILFLPGITPVGAGAHGQGGIMASNAINITTGDIQRGTTQKLELFRKDVLTYLAIFIPATAAASYFDVSLGLLDSAGSGQMYERNNGPIGLLVMIVSVIFQCRLFGTMLGKGDVSGRYLGFIGMAIVTFFGVGLATVLLIVPGLIVAARWLMAPCIYVDQQRGVFDALGESWNRTRGNTRPVIFAILLFVVVMVVIALVIGGLIGLFGSPAILAHLTDAFIGEVATVILIGMSITTYGLLSGQGEELASVFE